MQIHFAGGITIKEVGISTATYSGLYHNYTVILSLGM
jgi:hypothetical protein